MVSIWHELRVSQIDSLCPQFSDDATDRDALVVNNKSNRAADRALIVNLAAQIHDLEKSIRALRVQQDQAQKRLDSYTYPVLTLPNEIISEIFLHFLPTYPLSPPLHGLLSPTLLTHVCREWKDIAHATPALWRAITLYFTARAPFRDEQYNNLLRQWMSRSRSCPLSISIGGNDYYQEPVRCMETLASHRARWEYLELTWVNADFRPFLCDHPMPSLRHLNVSFRDQWEPTTIGDTPQLRSLRFTVYIDNLILPWQQLTSIILTSILPHQCTAILQQAASLVHCELSLCSNDDDRDHQPDTELPFVKSFILLPEEELETPYLYSLILPALHTLQIPEWDLGLDPIAGLKAFVRKSGCTLGELRIMGTRSVTAAAYRKAFPTIPQLSFPGYYEGELESDAEE
ncbi:hypothetical protein C8R43DRAFT_1109844 [Mycena crocata]|nr:hypothetical protein C8R43DRAFT_1109844 [Mycena crocata]